MSDRRFIEETFPVKEVSAESAREKNIRHGHISTLHIWWARRPLASSRATAYAALVPAPDDPVEREKQRQFIAELSKWENSLNSHLLERARRDILEAHAERLSKERGEPVTVEDIEAGRAPRPRVLDPFAGGGAIPLEALRLGCEVHASDYNPVAVLILKATLEYPQKYGRPFEGMPEHLLAANAVGAQRAAPGSGATGRSPLREDAPAAMELPGLEGSKEVAPDFNPLLAAVKYWGDWVLAEAREELAQFYPQDPDGSVPVGYIWARTIPCQNPACQAEIPLMRQFWLAKKKDREIALHPLVRDGRVEFEIVARGKKAVGAQLATCPVCGSTVEAKTTRRLFQGVGANGGSPAGQRMVAVVLTKEGRSGKSGRPERQVLPPADRG